MAQIHSVPTLGGETARIRAAYAAVIHEWRNDQSGPLTYVAEVEAQQNIDRLQLLNSSGNALQLRTATGSDLDDLVALVDVTRRVSETDAELRARVPIELRARAEFTVPAILDYVRALDGVSDASLDRGANYAATIYVQADDYAASDATLRTAVQTALNAPAYKPVFVDFTVAAETRTAYTIRGTITYSPDQTEADIKPLVDAAVEANLLAQRRLNRGLSLSAIDAAAVAIVGVHSAAITATPSPAVAAVGTVPVATIDSGGLTYNAGTGI